MSQKTQNLSSMIWDVADILRGLYKESEYGEVIIPLTVLRRLDSMISDKKELMIEVYEEIKHSFKEVEQEDLEEMILKELQLDFYNISGFSFESLISNPDMIYQNLETYINGFSTNVLDIFENFSIKKHFEKLNKNNLLYAIIQRFYRVDLSPKYVSQVDMGDVFEEILRKFADMSGETAGEHFTPQEIVELMTDILLIKDSDILSKNISIRTIYDPTCGTGNMLSVSKKKIMGYNDNNNHVLMRGQEINEFSYAMCKAAFLMKNINTNEDLSGAIHLGDTLAKDKFPNEKFDYITSNPPYGTDWKKIQSDIEKEHKNLGFKGRFGAGIPKISDASLLFVMHIISKMKDTGRAAIVLSGSPLFSGSAGSGESEIRKWIIENDWLDTIISLPTDLFYNTSIGSYIWILDKNKAEERKGRIQLINAVEYYEKMKKSKGNKRKEVTEEYRKKILRLYSEFIQTKDSIIFQNKEFGYTKVTIEHPLKLSIQITKEKIEKLKEDSSFIKIGLNKNNTPNEEGQNLQNKIINILNTFDEDKIYKSLNQFEKELKSLFKQNDLKINAVILKSITNFVSYKDTTAEVILDVIGNIQHDIEMRDNENIPLLADIELYFQNEVKPHAAEAWIDMGKSVVGYEIAFNRYFYQYQQLRPIEEVESDIKSLEQEILELLKGVTE